MEGSSDVLARSLQEMETRLDELRPLAEEYARLEAALPGLRAAVGGDPPPPPAELPTAAPPRSPDPRLMGQAQPGAREAPDPEELSDEEIRERNQQIEDEELARRGITRVTDQKYG